MHETILSLFFDMLAVTAPITTLQTEIPLSVQISLTGRISTAFVRRTSSCHVTIKRVTCSKGKLCPIISAPPPTTVVDGVLAAPLRPSTIAQRCSLVPCPISPHLAPTILATPPSKPESVVTGSHSYTSALWTLWSSLCPLLFRSSSCCSCSEHCRSVSEQKAAGGHSYTASTPPRLPQLLFKT